MECDLRRQLALGMEQLRVGHRPETLSALLEFHRLLSKWNQVYNLTAIRDPLTMISHHLLDSLSVSPYLHGTRVLDVGTGPGLPGIPLAILFPGKSFVLIDSKGKKTRFVRQVVLELGLDNVEVVQNRVEQFKNEVLFDTIVTRAFASVSDILSSSRHLLKQGGILLVMKGRLEKDEISVPGFRVSRIRVRVPGVEAERHLLVLKSETAES